MKHERGFTFSETRREREELHASFQYPPLERLEGCGVRAMCALQRNLSARKDVMIKPHEIAMLREEYEKVTGRYTENM